MVNYGIIFCDDIKNASTYIMNGPHDILTQIDGYRYLTRVLRAGLSEFMEFNDDNLPKLHALVFSDHNIYMGFVNLFFCIYITHILMQISYIYCTFLCITLYKFTH